MVVIRVLFIFYIRVWDLQFTFSVIIDKVARRLYIYIVAGETLLVGPIWIIILLALA